MASIRELRAKFTADTRALTTGFRDASRQAAALGTSADRSAQQAQRSYSGLITSTGRLRDALGDAADDDAFNELRQAIERAEREVEELGSASESAMQDLGRAIENSGSHFSGLSDDARLSLNRIEDAVNGVDQELRTMGNQNGLNGLANDASDATQNLNNLEDNINDVDRATDNAEEGIRDFGDAAERESNNAESAFGKIGKAAGGLVGIFAGVFAIDAISEFGTELAASAGAAKASKSQFTTVFGDLEKEAAASLKSISDEATILPERMKDSFTKIAAFAKTGGMDTADSLDLASRSMRAVADSAAFYDRSLEDTTESLQSYLKGNYENDAALGISSTETTRNAAANEAYGKSFKDLSEAQKQLTLLKMVEDANKLTGAMGQASRESTGWENVVGNMSQAWDNFKAKIGGPVLGVAVKALVGMTGAMEALNTEAISSGIEKAFNFIAKSIGLARSAIKPLIGGFKTLQEVVRGLLTDDGQKGRDLLKTLGFSEEMIMMMDGYAAKFAGFRGKIIDFINGFKQLFVDDGSVGRDLLASVGISPDIIAKLDNFAMNFSAFRYGVADTFKAIMKIFQGDRAGGFSILESLGFTPDFILKIDAFVAKVKGIASQVSAAASAIGAGLAEHGPKILNTIQSVMIDVWPKVKAAVSGIASFIGSTVSKIAQFWAENGTQIMAAVSSLFNGISKVIQFIMPFVLAIIKSVWGNIKGVITGALDIIMGVIKIFSGLFTGDFAKMWEGVKQLFSGAVRFIWNFVQLTFYGKILGGAKGFIVAFKGGFSAMWGAVKGIFTTGIGGAWTLIKNGWKSIADETVKVFKGIWGFLSGTFNAIKNVITFAVKGYFNILRGGWSLIFNTTKTIFLSVFNFLKGIFSSIRNSISGSVSNILTSVRNTWNLLKTNTSGAFRDIFNGIKNKFTDIVNLAKGLPKRIGDGIGAMASKVTSGVTKVINALARTLGKGVNGVIGGVNWVLGKIGVDKDIPKWDVPQYAQGTKGHHPGGPMIVGDGKGTNAGPELIETPDGKQMLSPKKPTLTSAPKGTKVWSATATREILKMIPHYAFGDKVRAAGEWVSDKYEAGKTAVKSAAKKVKDVAVNAYDYIKSPGKFLDLALKTLGISKPKGGGLEGSIAGGGWNKIKSAAVDFIKNKLNSFGESQSGITVMGGNGGGFGAPFRLTSKPGPRNTGIPGASTFHKGWDWAAPTGTPIPSVSDGVVTRNSWHPLSGNFVEVKTGGRTHRYQHNSRNLVNVGQSVKKGQTIALVGATGVGSGSHLHYELKGYEDGGIVDGSGGPQLAWLTEGGFAESVISHDPSKKTSQRAIWEETGRELGFDTDNAEVLAMLERIAEGVENGHVLQMDRRTIGALVAPDVQNANKRTTDMKNKFK